MRRLAEYLPLLWVSVLAAYPIMTGIPDFVDATNHFYRIAALDWHLQHFDFYPRWFSDLHYGFGAPVFNFYAPLSYYGAIIFRVFGFSIQTCYALGYGLALMLLVSGTFTWARAAGHSWEASWGAGAVSAFTPYLYLNNLMDGRYAETWGLAILPWLFWAALRLTQTPSVRAGLMFSFIYACLILTHNITTFIATPIIILYLIFINQIQFRTSANRDWLFTLRHLSSFMLGLALAGFFLIPVAFESSNVLLREARNPFFLAEISFSSLGEFFSLPSTYDPLRVNNPRGHALPIVGGILALVGLSNLLFAIKKGQPRVAKAQFFIFHFSFFIILTFFALPYAKPIWQLIPLGDFVQFPWRVLGHAMFFLALCAAEGIEALSSLVSRFPSSFPFGTRPSSLFIRQSSFVVLLVFTTLPYTFHRPYDPYPLAPTPYDFIQHEIKTGFIGSTVSKEFVPKWVSEFPSADLMTPRYEKNTTPSHIGALPEGVKCQTVNLTLKTEEVKCESAQAFTLPFYQFYFPGWVATIDNQEVPLSIASPSGNLTIAVAAGSHTIKVALQPTAPQVVGTLISLIALVLFITLFIMNPSPSTTSTSSNFLIRTSLMLSAFIVLLLLVRIFYLDKYETIFSYTELDKLPNPTSVNFGNQVELIGYTLPPPVSSGDVLRFKLFWKPLPPVTADYAVTVQLADRWGNRFGASDSQHPDLVPTSKWRPNQYAHDAHNLQTFTGTPPGEYRLLVSLYNKAQKLNVMRDGALAEVEYELGTVVIERGATQPASELRLVEYSVATRDLSVGDALLFTTLWHTGNTDSKGVAATISFTDSQNQLGAVKNFLLSGPDYTPDKWNRNELVRYPHAIIVPPELKAGAYRVGVTLNTGAKFNLGEIKVSAPVRSFVIPEMPKRVNYDFSQTIRLLGYEIRGDSITLYWQAQQTVEKRLTTFVHNLENGKVTSGHDALPLRATTSWVVGEVITDTHPLNVGGEFEIGLYDATTGERFGEVFLTKR